jgi:hypothetical protein
VEVVYALPRAQETVVVGLPAGSRVRDAVEASGLAVRYGLAEETWQLGIGGRRVTPQQALQDGDRVEILRPLAADPKEARRARVRRKRRASR